MTHPEPPEGRFTRARRKAGGRKRSAAGWPAIRERIDLAEVARRLLGEPPGRRGHHGARLWWPCPFHPDRNPSFCVEPGRPWWRCFGCGQHGDAAGLVMKHQRLGFPEAVAFLVGEPIAAGAGTPRPRRPKPAPDPPAPFAPAPKPADERNARAQELADLAAGRLWTPEGRPALEYLRGRGLGDDAIRAARLGYAPNASPPGARSPTFRGVTVPWFGPRGIELLKVRQLDGREPRYGELYRRQPRHYPGDPLTPGAVAIVVEGELDALLLGQELHGLARVITMGPASSRPSAELSSELAATFRLYVATDADPAGEGASRHFPARAVRVRPPEPHKDWTEAHQAGVALRAWWMERLLDDPDEAPAVVSTEAPAEVSTGAQPEAPAEARAEVPVERGPGMYGISPDRARRPAIAARGDAMRDAGEALPLCWLPEPQEKWVPPPMPGRRDDGRPWFEGPG